MNKLFLFFLGISIFFFNLSFINANFACGFVSDSQEYSSAWETVLIYPENNNSNFITCKVNSENKFCCDLEEIKGKKLSVGDIIVAEISDNTTGLVAGPVILTITGEGYDLFPNMTLRKAITINSPFEKIFINKSSIFINVSLTENYTSLKYIINSSGNVFEEQVCVDCNNTEFLIPLLDKGKNEITLIAFGDNGKEIHEKIMLYNLDYFNFGINFSCDKCYLKNKVFYVPSNRSINVTSYLNASHNLSGEFLLYFPSEWSSFDFLNAQDFSSTHEILKENISEEKEYSVQYTFKTPEIFIKKEYSFYQKFENQEKISKVIVFKSKLIPFHIPKRFERNHFYYLPMQKCSINEPVILNSDEEYLNLVAIFPRRSIEQSYSNLNFDVQKRFFKKQDSFTIFTSIQKKDIDYIFLSFKVEEGKSINVYSNKNKINLELYKKESNYEYYSARVSEKGPFVVNVF